MILITLQAEIIDMYMCYWFKCEFFFFPSVLYHYQLHIHTYILDWTQFYGIILINQLTEKVMCR